MSNTLAIGAVTATLRHLLDRASQPLVSTGDPDPDPDLSDAACTTRTPDKARDPSATGNQLNLFLYLSAPNAAMRNMSMPGRGSDGDLAAPPVALTLYYLISGYGAGGDEVKSHRLLGRAMAILHVNSRLERADILAITGEAPGNDLAQQIERVRITPHNVSSEEMSKLWTMFQTPYRVSIAYEVSVVLIDNAMPNITPLPVLRRGRSDHPTSPWSGPGTFPSLVPTSPQLSSVTIEEPNSAPPPAMLSKPSARIGTSCVLTLSGTNLAGTTVVAQFVTAARPGVVLTLLPLAGATTTRVQFALPPDPVNWPAGFYNVALLISKPGDSDRQTNALGFTLAPRIVSITPNPVTRDGAANITLTVTFSPQVRPEQRVSLLVGDIETVAGPHGQVGSLTFVVAAVDPSPPVRWVRLRVDGVDSLLVSDYTIAPPTFDPSQGVTVT
jgi:hypothetical protein